MMDEYQTRLEGAKREAYEKAREAIKQLFLAMSSTSCREEFIKGLTDGFIREHRTHQQSMGGVLVNFLREYVAHDGFDLRNKAFMEAARKMVEAADESMNGAERFPFI
jgi:hypothetical protein